MADVRVGILGCGNVGSALVRLLADNEELIARRVGVRLQVTNVAVRDLRKPRDIRLPGSVLSDDAHSVVIDPSVDVVVETIGGVEPARSLVLGALKSGKPVVTANK